MEDATTRALVRDGSSGWLLVVEALAHWKRYCEEYPSQTVAIALRN